MISLFGKKKERATGKQGSLPNLENEIEVLSSRGLHENDIRNALLKRGYRENEIEDAMRSHLKSKIKGAGENPKIVGAVGTDVPPGGSRPPVFKQPPFPVGAGEASHKGAEEVEHEIPEVPKIKPPGFDVIGRERPVMPTIPSPRPVTRPEPAVRAAPVKKAPGHGMSRKEVEELVEVVVEEKMKEIEKKISSLADLSKVEQRIDRLENEIKLMKEERDKINNQIVERMESYNQTITDIDAKMGAVEKAFKDTLTPMLESMRSLTEAIRQLKKEKK